MKACRSSSAMRSTVGGAVCASVFSAVSPSLCFSDVAGNPRFFSRSVTALGEGSGLDGCFVRLPKEPKNDIGALATDPGQPECLQSTEVPLLLIRSFSRCTGSDYSGPIRRPKRIRRMHLGALFQSMRFGCGYSALRRRDLKTKRIRRLAFSACYPSRTPLSPRVVSPSGVLSPSGEAGLPAPDEAGEGI